MKHSRNQISSVKTLLAPICAAVSLHAGTLTRAAAPVITVQPKPAQISAGYTTLFSVGLSAQPLTEQWQKDNLPIPGPTNSMFQGLTFVNSYTITNAQPTNAGAYNVVVSNSSGSTTSSIVSLTVFPPFTFITMAGGAGSFSSPRHLTMDSHGNFLVTDLGYRTIRKLTPDGGVSALAAHDATGSNVTLFSPHGITIDKADNVYVSLLSCQIVKIDPDGLVTTLAGAAQVAGTNDGIGSAARFRNPWGIAVDGNGNLFVTDTSTVRELKPVGTDWMVTTIAGSPASTGLADGTNDQARFNFPDGLAVDAAGNIFVADEDNNCLRKITPAGTNWVVTTVAGGGSSSVADGVGTGAAFFMPSSVALGLKGELYVTDQGQSQSGGPYVRPAIRMAVSDGTNWFVSTVAGLSNGTNDGTGSAVRFGSPHGVVVDGSGNLIVVDFYHLNNNVRKGWSADAAPVTFLDPPVVSLGQVALGFRVVTGAPTNFTLLQTGQLGEPWSTNFDAVLSTNIPGLSYRLTAPPGGDTSEYYLLQQQ